MSMAHFPAAIYQSERTVGRQEARRRFVVRAVIFIFALSLIEGPLRKWLLPELAGPLTLLRDPFVIGLYGYCYLNGLILRHRIATLWSGFALFSGLFGLVQYMIGDLSPAGWMLGVRSYWLYMPMAFVVAKNFRPEDVYRFLLINLWIAIPYAALVAVQYNSPPDSFINRGVGGGEDSAVMLSRDVLRPFGVFTYTGPNVQFTAAVIAAFFAIYLSGSRQRPSRLLYWGSTIAVCTMAVLTGSRAIYFLAAAIVCITVWGILASRAQGVNAGHVGGIFVLSFISGGILIYVFPDMLEAMVGRLESAERAEGAIWQRALSSVSRPFDALTTAPVFGYGIGAGASGVSSFLGLPSLVYGEEDLHRNINELGVVIGLVFWVLRFGTSIWLVGYSFALARQGVSIALPLAGFVIVPIAIGQITHSPLNGFLPWLFFGLLLSFQGVGRHRNRHLLSRRS